MDGTAREDGEPHKGMHGIARQEERDPVYSLARHQQCD